MERFGMLDPRERARAKEMQERVQADPRFRLVQTCPGCHREGEASFIWHAIPSIELKLNSFARCMRCLLAWEVTPLGSIVNKLYFGAGVTLGAVFPAPDDTEQ